MRLSSLAQCALGMCAAVALLAGGADAAGHRLQPVWMGTETGLLANIGSVVRPDVRVPGFRTSRARPYNDRRMALQQSEIAVSDSQNGVVNIYLLSPPHTMVGQLTGFMEPQGLAVDRHNNLYVTNTRGGNILVFAPGATSPFLTLDDIGNLPVGVAVDADGTVYVTNILKARGPAGIVVYPKGATKPSRTLTDANISADYFVAIGPSHDVYTTYFDQNGTAQVGEYPSNDPTLHSLNIVNFQFPGGIHIDDGDVLVDDQNARALLAFEPPRRHPFSFIPFIGAGDPISFDYGATEGTVWVADGDGLAEHYAWSGRLIDSINVGGVPIGIAVLFQRR